MGEVLWATRRKPDGDSPEPRWLLAHEKALRGNHRPRQRHRETKMTRWQNDAGYH